MISEVNYLLEPLTPATLQLLSHSNETPNLVSLIRTHRPLPHVDSFVLPPGTKGTLVDQNPHSVCWMTKYSFWLAVHCAEASLLTQVSKAEDLRFMESVVTMTVFFLVVSINFN